MYVQLEVNFIVFTKDFDSIGRIKLIYKVILEFYSTPTLITLKQSLVIRLKIQIKRQRKKIISIIINLRRNYKGTHLNKLRGKKSEQRRRKRHKPRRKKIRKNIIIYNAIKNSPFCYGKCDYIRVYAGDCTFKKWIRKSKANERLKGG